MPPQRLPRTSLGQSGFSLVEVVVALAIGMLVVAAVLSTYLSTSLGQRVQGAAAQMDEDAQLALRLLSSELMLAGYSEPSGLVQASGGQVAFQRLAVPNFLQECGSGSFGSAGLCATKPSNQSGAMSLLVSYEATRFNTLRASNSPSDCLGNSLGTARIVINRYYLSSASGLISLQCLGSALGSDGKPLSSAPLVSNIEGLMFWFGQAVEGSGGGRQVVRHVAAAQLAESVSASPTASPFDSVNSVRVCVLVRSVEPVVASEASISASYLDCDLKTQVSADRRLRRAYFTTVALRNKMPW